VLRTGWWTVFQHPFDFTQFSLENYTTVLTAEGMGQAFLNSLTIAIPATIIPIAIATFAAYALAWMEFPGRQWLFIIIVALLVVPLQMTFIPILRAYRELGVAGSFSGRLAGPHRLRHAPGNLPAAQLHRLSPQGLIEAAAVDGASHLKIFTRLIVPLSMPAIASFAVFQFLWVWNDLLVALVYLGGTPDVAPCHPQTFQHGRFPWAGLARPHRRSLHHHDCAVDRLLFSAALLCARSAGRFSEGMRGDNTAKI
jgi:alpha-glucoside transport system permease protein